MKSLRESLKRIDLEMLDNDNYCDLLNLYESVSPQITAEDQAELTKCVKEKNYDKLNTYLSGIAARSNDKSNMNKAVKALTIEEDLAEDELDLDEIYAEEEALDESRSTLQVKPVKSIASGKTKYQLWDYREKEYASYRSPYWYNTKEAAQDAINDTSKDLGYTDKTKRINDLEDTDEKDEKSAKKSVKESKTSSKSNCNLCGVECDSSTLVKTNKGLVCKQCAEALQSEKKKPQALTEGIITKGPFIVTVYYDSSKGKYRAKADDGIHGEYNCRFPNALRTKEQYFIVSQLDFLTDQYNVPQKVIMDSYDTWEDATSALAAKKGGTNVDSTADLRVSTPDKSSDMPANKVTADTVKQETPEERQERFKTKWGITNWDDLYDDSEDDLNEAVESESDNAIKQQAQQWPQNSNLNASITQLIKHPFKNDTGVSICVWIAIKLYQLTNKGTDLTKEVSKEQLNLLTGTPPANAGIASQNARQFQQLGAGLSIRPSDDTPSKVEARQGEGLLENVSGTSYVRATALLKPWIEGNNKWHEDFSKYIGTSFDPEINTPRASQGAQPNRSSKIRNSMFGADEIPFEGGDDEMKTNVSDDKNLEMKQEIPEERQERFKTKWGITNWDDLYDDSEDDSEEISEDLNETPVNNIEVDPYEERAKYYKSLYADGKIPYEKERVIMQKLYKNETGWPEDRKLERGNLRGDLVLWACQNAAIPTKYAWAFITDDDLEEDFDWAQYLREEDIRSKKYSGEIMPLDKIK